MQGHPLPLYFQHSPYQAAYSNCFCFVKIRASRLSQN